MKFIYLLLLPLLLVACSGNEEQENDPVLNPDSDTLESGIIEYDLNEVKLSAVDFNNELSLIQQNVWNQLDLLFMADSASVDDQFETTLFEIETKLTDVNQMYVPTGGERLSGALVNLLTYYRDQLTNKMKSLLPLMKKPLDQVTRQDAGQLNEFDLAFAAKEKELVLTFAAEQDAFAAANNFQMQEL